MGLAIPVAGRHHLICDDRELRLGRGAPCRLVSGVTPVAGAALFDGAFVALVVEAHASSHRSALILSATSARLHRRVPVPAGNLRIAQRRGLLIVRSGPRALVAIDLRLGGVLGRLETVADLDDFAVDDDGVTVAVRHGRELQLHEVGDWTDGAAAPRPDVPMASSPANDEVPTRPARPAAVREAPAPELAPEVEPTAIPRPFDLRALGRRPASAPVSAAAARRLLDEELRTVGLRALVAVARGWDTRRIGYPADSAHPYEMEVAAILGMNEGHAPEHLAAATERLAAHELRPGRPPRSTRPSDSAGRARRRARVVVARPRHPHGRRGAGAVGRRRPALRVVANDPDRALVDELLIQHVLEPAGGSAHDVSRELAPGAPLVRLGLVHVGARPRPFAPLTVEPVVLARLRAEPVDLGAGAATTVHRADRGLDDLLVPRDRVVAAIRHLSRPASAEHPVRSRCAGGPAAAGAPSSPRSPPRRTARSP